MGNTLEQSNGKRNWVAEVLREYQPPAGVEPGTEEFENFLFDHMPPDVAEIRRRCGLKLQEVFDRENPEARCGENRQKR